MLQALAPELANCEPGKLASKRLPALEFVIRMGDERTPGMLNYGEVASRGASVLDTPSLDRITASLDCHDPINIQFTSGTTGNPKGATLTHHNVVNNARFVAQAMRLRRAGLAVHPGAAVPLLRHGAGGAGLRGDRRDDGVPRRGVRPGAPRSRRWPKSAAPRCTACRRCSSPSSTHREFAQFDLSTLRTGIMAGSPCPIETMKRVVAQMHMREVTIAYGMTETSPVSFQSATDDPLDKRVTTVGRVQPHLEVKVVGADGHVVPVGEKGELCTRGYSVMQRLLGRRRAHAGRRARRLDAHRRPGDDRRGRLLQHRRPRQGHADPRRRERLSARDRGVPVPPPEGAVGAGVRRARPEVRRGGLRLDHPEAGRAGLTEDEIRDFCRDQIAHYKVPRYIRFVDEMPMTVTGKVQKFVMRDRMIDELKLTQDRTA